MFASSSAGSLHTVGRTRFQPGSRCGTAVSPTSTRQTAPWKCSNRIVLGDGIVANRSIAVSISPSDRPVVKLESQ